MRFAKIENNIVIQIQPNLEDGFIEVDDSVCCGMVLENGKFIVSIVSKTEEEIEVERIQSIKQRAGEIIKSKYSIEWQLNYPRLDETYISQYDWIDNIRKISNEAESNGTSLEDINWGI